MLLLHKSGLFRRLNQGEIAQPSQVIDTLNMTEEDARTLVIQLTEVDNLPLLQEVIDEWANSRLFPQLTGQEDVPHFPLFTDNFYNANTQTATLDIVGQQEVLLGKVLASESDSENEQMATEEEMAIEKLQREIQELDKRIKAIDKVLYRDFITREGYHLRTQNIQTWHDGIQKLRQSYTNPEPYITALSQTKGVCLHVYEPYAIYPFSYQGAKDANECGFIAGVLNSVFNNPGTRLVEPFVGGARIFLACKFSRHLIADLDPALIAFYKIIQQFPTFATNYHTDLQHFLLGGATPESLFNDSVQYMNDTASLATLNNSSEKARKDWARSYIYIRNRGQRPTVNFGDVKAKYQGVKNENQYELSEQAALVELAKRCIPQQTEIKCQGWKQTFAETQVGDIIYADPPYVEFTLKPGVQKTPLFCVY